MHVQCHSWSVASTFMTCLEAFSNPRVLVHVMQGIIDELGVVAQLLEVGDSRQDSHRLLSRDQLPGCLGREEMVVQIPLQVCQLAAHHLNDLHRSMTTSPFQEHRM